MTDIRYGRPHRHSCDVYRTATVPVGDAKWILDSGDVSRIRPVPAIDGVFATTKMGLYRSMDDGQPWVFHEMKSTLEALTEQ